MQMLFKPAFGLSILLCLFAVATMALPTNEPDVYDLMKSMNHDDNGVTQLSGDGVLRTFAPNLTVLSYAQLTNQQIQTLIDSYGRDDNLTKAYEGVNGHDVADPEQLTHPGKDLLPVAFPHAKAPTSENPATHGSFKRVNAPENCPHVGCYGKGNCPPKCTDCYIPYPGYQGNCY